MSKKLCTECGIGRAELQGTRRRICDRCQRKKRSVSSHALRVTKTYGLEPGQYDLLLWLQGGVCAGCSQPRSYRLNVDHDHRTGYVRGLCCRRCNKVLRDVRDDPDVLRSLAQYLRLPPAQVAGIWARAEENP